jgi:hypothetical protein
MRTVLSSVLCLTGACYIRMFPPTETGEVVLEAQYKNQPTYIKIMATNKGVQVPYSER